MPHPRFSRGEIAERGESLYEQSIRERVEAEENIGQILSIDIETGDYAIGDDPVQTAGRLQAAHPGAGIWTKRIGDNAVYALGGTLTRTAP
jgi:hypothetical protein